MYHTCCCPLSAHVLACSMEAPLLPQRAGLELSAPVATNSLLFSPMGAVHSGDTTSRYVIQLHGSLSRQHHSMKLARLWQCTEQAVRRVMSRSWELYLLQLQTVQ